MKNHEKMSYGSMITAITGGLAAAFMVASLMSGGTYGEITDRLFGEQPDQPVAERSVPQP